MMKNKKIGIIAGFTTLLIAVSCISVFGAKEAENTLPGGYTHLTADGKIDMAAYWESEGVSIAMQEESIDFVMDETEATITFNKPLASDSFRLAFAGIDGNKLRKAEFFLTDVENDEITTSLVATSMGDDTYNVRLGNARRPVMVNGSFQTENDYDLCINYDAAANYFTDGSTWQIPIVESEDGSIFGGFTSHKVMLTIKLHGEKGAIFRLKSLNQQRWGNRYIEDTENPSITIVNNVKKGVYGSIVTLPQAFALDVLAERATVTMSVTDPEGNEVTAVDGTKLAGVTPNKNYQIKLDQYGRYNLNFQATDGINTTRNISTQLVVADREDPVITLSKEASSLVKVGDVMTLPEAEYSDNVSSTITHWITVEYPNGIIKEIIDAQITFEEEGIYEVTYSAMDEAGNIARLKVDIYAEEG